VVIGLERGADLHMAQLMPLPLTVSCFSKIQIGFTFWYQLTWVVPEKGRCIRCSKLVLLYISCVFHLVNNVVASVRWTTNPQQIGVVWFGPYRREYSFQSRLSVRLYLPVLRKDKKLSYRCGTARCVVSVEILPIATQQCRNYLYDKS